MILYQKCTTFDRSFQNILTEAKSIRIVKVGGHDSHLPFSLTYHRRFQFTDFFSYPPSEFLAHSEFLAYIESAAYMETEGWIDFSHNL